MRSKKVGVGIMFVSTRRIEKGSNAIVILYNNNSCHLPLIVPEGRQYMR